MIQPNRVTLTSKEIECFFCQPSVEIEEDDFNDDELEEYDDDDDDDILNEDKFDDVISDNNYLPYGADETYEIQIRVKKTLPSSLIEILLQYLGFSPINGIGDPNFTSIILLKNMTLKSTEQSANTYDTHIFTHSRNKQKVQIRIMTKKKPSKTPGFLDFIAETSNENLIFVLEPSY
jgi:hypothetical protein